MNTKTSNKKIVDEAVAIDDTTAQKDAPSNPDAAKVEGDTPAKPKYPKEELLKIFDEMIFSGEYSEDVSIKGRLQVRFRSRSAADMTDISRDIDNKNFVMMATLSEYRALLNLSYSLIFYSGKDLTEVSPAERQKFISKLPGVIVGALSDALVKFDEKIDLACREGQENF